MHTFNDFNEWRQAITIRCGLELTRAYCHERVEALLDPAISSTKNFIDTYGEEYLQQVITWFRRASEEAVS